MLQISSLNPESSELPLLQRSVHLYFPAVFPISPVHGLHFVRSHEMVPVSPVPIFSNGTSFHPKSRKNITVPVSDSIRPCMAMHMPTIVFSSTVDFFRVSLTCSHKYSIHFSGSSASFVGLLVLTSTSPPCPVITTHVLILPTSTPTY